VVEIAATLTDFGIEERPKTTAGWRRIALPAETMQMIGNRIGSPAIATDVAVLPGPLGRLRNRSNTTADLRRALDRIGFRWVSRHTFRKTAITRLDDARLSARQIADHVGHARPSMTQDVSMGRSVASSALPRSSGGTRRTLRRNGNDPGSAFLLVRGRMEYAIRDSNPEPAD
jgi:integrase